MRLMLVEWEDSRQPTSQWQRLSDFTPPDPCLCVSVGFLIEDGEDTKVLAANLADIHIRDDIQASGIICIPTRCITRLVELGEGTDIV